MIELSLFSQALIINFTSLSLIVEFRCNYTNISLPCSSDIYVYIKYIGSNVTFDSFLQEILRTIEQSLGQIIGLIDPILLYD